VIPLLKTISCRRVLVPPYMMSCGRALFAISRSPAAAFAHNDLPMVSADARIAGGLPAAAVLIPDAFTLVWDQAPKPARQAGWGLAIIRAVRHLFAPRFGHDIGGI